MSIFGSIKRFLGLKAPTIIDQAVLALSASPLGEIVAADIRDMANKEMGGSQKFEAVLKRTLPEIVKIATSKTEREVAIKDVEDIGRALVQRIFNAEQSTKASWIAALVMAVLKR